MFGFTLVYEYFTIYDRIDVYLNIIDDFVLFQSEACSYPCTCPSPEVCSECEECPRQLGEPCSPDRACDSQKGYICKYKHEDAEGICRGKNVAVFAI